MNPIASSWKNIRKLKGACLTCKHFHHEVNAFMMEYWSIIGICKLFPSDPAYGLVTKHTTAPPCVVWSYEKAETGG